MEMLSLPTWREEPLTLHFFSSSHLELQCGGPPLPPHMRVDVAPMEVSIYVRPLMQHHSTMMLRSICKLVMPRVISQFAH